MARTSLRIRLVRSALLGGVLAMLHAPAIAEVAGAASSEDIIVTARKREERLVDVPVAVTALSSADISRYAATDLNKIGQLIPQVMFVKLAGGGSGGALVIRGLGSSAEDAGIEQSVAMNIDGVQLSRGRAAFQSYFDVQQIEVLKGPQALFFGKNSPGGVISVTTAGPTNRLEGYVRAGYEFKADERYIEGAISGPLTESLGVRVAARGSKMTGYVTNIAKAQDNIFEPGFALPTPDRRQPNARELAGRLTVAWKPEGPFDATLKIFASDAKDNAQSIEEVICRPGEVPSVYGVADPTGDCTLNGIRSVGVLNPDLIVDWANVRDGRQFSTFKSQFGSLTMGLDLGSVSLTSVTGFYHYVQKGVYNVDFTSWAQVVGVNNDTYTSWTQELRLDSKLDGPVNFMLGGFFETVDYKQQTDAKLFALGPDTRNGKYHTWERPGFSTGKNVSLFGQVNWQIADRLELAGGARWVWEKKTVQMSHSFFNDLAADVFGDAFLPEGVVVEGDYRDQNISPEVTLTFHPTSRSTLYAAYKTGYKSGGFSLPSALTSDYINPANAEFGSEKASGGEIGAKGSFLDNRLSINAAIYRYKFKGLQLSSFNAATTSFTIRNAASARTTGAEIDAQFNASDQLSLRGSVGYNEAQYLRFPTGSCYQGQSVADGCLDGVQDLSGTPLVRAPRWTASGGFSYEIPLAAALRLSINGDINYTGSYITQENQDPLARQDGIVRVNAGIRLHEADERWDLSLIGRNLTNKRYLLGSSDKVGGEPGQLAATPSRPREVVLQATMQF